MSIITITGGTGLIGRALTRSLLADGHEVRILGRRAGQSEGAKVYPWEPAAGRMDQQALIGVDHIVHLAGAGIADKRWTRTRVQELIESRTNTALLLLRESKALGVTPRSFISAAGINYYGAFTSDHVFTEEDPPGQDTIGQISSEWEMAVREWEGTCRTVRLRTPVVLATEGGALPKLIAPIRWGLGAAFGTGRQWMPWVHLEDLVAVYRHALDQSDMQGAYNVDSGHAVTNAELMRTAARTLGKPFFLPSVPGFLLRLALGEMAALLLVGSRASNERLLASGFRFRHTDLATAFKDLLLR